MAVSLNTGGFFMSEFMISDAALAMRMQEMQQEQATDFAALLDGFDSTENPEAAKPGQVNQPERAQTEQPEGRAPKESTNLKSQEAPEDKYVSEKPEKFKESEEDEDKPAVKATTTEQMTFAALHAVEIDSEISAEFEEITASLSENAETKEIVPVTAVDDDAETFMPVQQVIPEETAEPEAAESVFEVPQEQSDELVPPELTEILKSVEDLEPEEAEEPQKLEKYEETVETKAIVETAEIVDTKVTVETEESMETVETVDNAVRVENAERPVELTVDNVAKTETVVSEAVTVEESPRAVKAQQDKPEKVQTVKPEDSKESAEQTFVKESTEAPAEITAQVAETVTLKQDAEPTVVKAETKQSVIEAVSEESRTPTEVSYSVKGAAKAQTESENGSTDTAGSEKSFEVFRGAAEKGEISAPEVRTVTREVPVKAEQTEEKPELVQPVQTARVEQSEEQPRTQRTEDSRTTSVTEELEMLKNAKNKSAQTQEKPAVSTESPLTANAPITLTRANGERVEVRPSEIIEQATAKLVETAQTMKEQEATEYSLVLNPEELGRIVVKLVKAADGAVSVSIAAENTRTQRILEQHSAAMQENLRDSGVKLEGWQMVRESEQETYAQDYNGSSKNPYYREEDHSHSESESEETSFADLIASM